MLSEADFKVQRVSKVVFPNGLSFRKGEEDMEGGKVIFIEKFPKGYAVSGQEFDWDNQLPGEEAYTYYYDLQGSESTEDEIVPDGYFKTDSDMTEMKKKHSKIMKENAGAFFADFKSKFANYIQDYEEAGLDEEVNVVDSNMGIDEYYQYPKASILVNHAVKSLQAAGVDTIEKLYAKNNLKYAGESLDEFFQNLKANETYRGVDFTLIPGVEFSFTEEV